MKSPIGGSAEWKNAPKIWGARNKLTGLSVITLSSLTERFFKDNHTIFYEIYGAEQCKNRDY
jgi:hypothetical protein